jgi:hypothetical protein
VLTRLRRIEALERERAAPQLLLAELRELVREAEAWVRVEPGGSERAEAALGRAEAALGRCRDALDQEAAMPAA